MGRLFNGVMRVATGLAISDTQCGFKLFRADVAQEVFSRQLLERFGFDAEVLYIADRRGYASIAEVPGAMESRGWEQSGDDDRNAARLRNCWRSRTSATCRAVSLMAVEFIHKFVPGAFAGYRVVVAWFGRR